MGLPSKKQLHKHHRGARKALDTLDALNGEEQKPVEIDNDNIAEVKEGDQSSSGSAKKKKQTKSPAKKKKPAKKAAKPVKAKEKKSTAPSGDDMEQSPEEAEAVEAVSLKEPVVEQSVPDEPVPTPVSMIPPRTTVQPAPEMVEKKEEISLEKPEISEQEKQTEEKVKPSQKEKSEQSVTGQGENLAQFADVEEDTQKDRFLSFRIEEEDYGIEIKYVTEIIVMHKVTEVPGTPLFIKGVINLRGKVIPVMDVRERFNLEARTYDDRTCIVVVEVSEVSVGLIVDTVNEVVDIPGDRIDPPPSTHSGVESSYISGMGKIGKKVKILLDLKNVLNLTD